MARTWQFQAEKFAEEIYPYIKRKLSSDNYDGDFCKALRSVVEKYRRYKNPRIEMDWGATRVCIIGSNFVLKFDYGKTDLFGGCYDEYLTYKKAKEDGYSHLFAKCRYFVKHGFSFFAMEKIDHIGETTLFEANWTEDEIDYVDSNVRDLHFMNFGVRDGYGVVIDYAASNDEGT